MNKTIDKENFLYLYADTVNWGAIDIYKHMNNKEYFKYYEIVRVELMEKLGLKVDPTETDSGFTMADISSKFIKPLFYKEDIKIGVKVGEILNEYSILLEYIVVKSDETLCSLGESKLVFINFRTGAKIPIPDDIKFRLNKIFASDN